MSGINVTQGDGEELAELVISGINELPEDFNQNDVQEVISDLAKKYNFSIAFIGAVWVLVNAMNVMAKKFNAASNA